MMAPATAAARISAPVLRACMSCSDCVVEVVGDPDGEQIDRLAADHAARAGRDGNASNRADLSRGERGVARLGREQRKRLGQQPVAGQNGHPFAVDDVVRGPPPPQRVVVHRRKIVVDERVGVDELDGACGRQRRGDRLLGMWHDVPATVSAAASVRMGRSRLPPASRL